MISFNTLFILSIILGILIITGCVWGYWSLNATITVACAGSSDSRYPNSVKIDRAILQQINQFIATLSPSYSYQPYIVKGNSMQYADIKLNDIVIVRRVSGLTEINPANRIVLLKDSKAQSDKCHYKIRRAWRIIDANLDVESFETIVREILASESFSELSQRAADKCPSANCLTKQALSKFISRKQENRNESTRYLLSSTYKSDEGKIQFSLHKTTSVQGIVEFVQRNPV